MLACTGGAWLPPADYDARWYRMILSSPAPLLSTGFDLYRDGW